MVAIICYGLISSLCEVSATMMICMFGLHMDAGRSFITGISITLPIQMFSAILFDYLHRIQKLLEKD